MGRDVGMSHMSCTQNYFKGGFYTCTKPKHLNTKIDLLGCDIGGAKELGVIYFPTNWGAKEPQNPPNHRVA